MAHDDAPCCWTSLGEKMFVNAVKQVLEMVIEMKNEKLKREIYTFLRLFINFICLQRSS